MSEGIILDQISKEDAKEINESCKEVLHNNLEDPIEEQPHTGREERNQYHRDYARILYSSAYRRLQGKMQFLHVKSDRFYRNRLTHSQEVLQIARTIAGALKRTLKNELQEGEAENIYGKDMYVIEATSLAHDIGNPPFGHYGEKILNNLMEEYGGYEGNAQTLRILNKLERKFPDHEGLCLSKRSLLGVLKYYRRREDSKKFIYDSDYEIIENEIIRNNAINIRTLDCQIMDLADEIAYGAHDLEDGLRQGFFTIDELLYEFNIHKEFEGEYSFSKENLVDEARKKAKRGINDSKSDSEEFFHFFLKELTSSVVDTLVKDVGWKDCNCEYKTKTGSTNDKELGFIKHDKLAKGLKALTFECITKTPTVTKYEKQGEKIIEDLFQMYCDTKFNKDYKLMPPEFRRIAEEDGKERAVCDYISGMMDTFAIDIHKRYFGEEEHLRLYRK